jgi:CRP-like cAMP-binding protein/thioredoxin reductase/Na+-translocating ferredoxin:NAD+ oxidoreductase RNF subunit RnfB
MRYQIAIVGAGPGGIAAACRAARAGDTHVLLEAAPQIAQTIHRYQKGKHVMAEPAILPLRAEAAFEAGRREAVLARWAADLEACGVKLRLGTGVSGIRKLGERHFELQLANGERCEAEAVILAIGVQGHPRKLGCPGEDLPQVQYQLDDPDAFRDEVIVVVGAGDAAIENALALAACNEVHLINRKSEFSRAKDGNNSAILAAIEQGRVKVHYNAGVERVEAVDETPPLRLQLSAQDGSETLACHRVIGRLGALAPRAFVEACGVQFPDARADALPRVSARYESNVEGLYIIGALAGYPLIKQAMNQGHEVVEFIRGRPVVPADEPLLRQKFRVFSQLDDVEAVLDVVQSRSPILQALNRLQLRELLLESQFHAPAADQRLYDRGDYGGSVFLVLSGEVRIVLPELSPEQQPRIRSGRLFGEMALISGRPRTAAAVAGADCTLLEVPRRTMLRLMASLEAIRDYVDRVFALRAVQTYLAPGVSEAAAQRVLEGTELRRLKAGETLYREEEPAEHLYLVRTGSVTLGSLHQGREQISAYVPAGQYFGEVDVLAGTPRRQQARAAIKAEVLAIPAAAFLALLDAHPEVRSRVRKRFQAAVQQRLQTARNPERGELMSFLLNQGLGEATDALLIDESLCVRCDQCEKACAATHGQVSRLDREAGATFDHLHVPTSCRHCEHPHCMKDCPPDAIHRAANGEVFIESTCIGCGNCERNCPYGVIQMGVEVPARTSLWQWMLFGRGPAPGSEHSASGGDQPKKAVKCDMCRDRPEGPACVQACPTGAALRVGPEAFFEVLRDGRR